MPKITFLGFSLVIIIYSVQEIVLDPTEDIKRDKTKILSSSYTALSTWYHPSDKCGSPSLSSKCQDTLSHMTFQFQHWDLYACILH